MFASRNPIVKEDVARICAHELPWRAFSGKTVLVSGANGFLPAYMVETLLYLNETAGTGCRVVGLVRNREKAEKRFSHVLGRSDFSLLVQDVCAPIEVDNKIDFIIHAASQASPKYYGIDPAGTLLANTLGTYNLLQLASKHVVEGFLFFSSGDVYGRVNQETPIKEADYGWLDPTDVRSCYGESKRLGETMCAAWKHQYGVPVKIVRIAHTYGPGLALNDGRVFADFVANIIRNEDIVLKSDGTARRPFLYLADATLAFFTVLLRGENGQAYNVANEAGDISVRELAELLVGLFPERKLAVKFVTGASQPGYIASKIQGGVPDTTKIRKLGWRPTTSLEEGFRRTVMSFECERVYS
jgi:nucleoside-diphosphate-sugar epimerase